MWLQIYSRGQIFHTKEMIWAIELNNQKGQSKAYKPEGTHGSRSVIAKPEDIRGSRSVSSWTEPTSQAFDAEFAGNIARLIKKSIHCHRIIRNWK